MCYVLSAEKIILNYFALNPDKTTITFGDIEVISCVTTRKCNNSILTKTDRDSIRDAVYIRKPYLKVMDGSSIIVLDRRDEFSLLRNIDMLNQTVPNYVLDALKEACKECAQ